MVTQPLASIKEKPNDSDNAVSNPSSGNNENSGSKHEEESLDVENYYDYNDEEGEPVTQIINDNEA